MRRTNQKQQCQRDGNETKLMEININMENEATRQENNVSDLRIQLGESVS